MANGNLNRIESSKVA